jgi:Ca2+/Na+ antiporter
MVIFYALAVAADQFFCPAVDTISEIFKLPPDVAGATLLSFGNGAPDVFTQVAAITHGTSAIRFHDFFIRLDHDEMC